jgi:5-methylcytosine-specific restriction endonuclease McrA
METETCICACGKIFERNIKGYKKKFCSPSCSNRRNHSVDTIEKISKSNKKAWENFSEEKRILIRKGISDATDKRKSTIIKNIMEEDWENLKPGTKSRRVMIEQDRKCLICNINEWLGKPITLELDHIDGNNKNNSRENLRYLCPNCHSQTETWRGRNNTGKRNSNYKHGLYSK